MPFKFRHLCDLLQSLDDNRVQKKVTSSRAKNPDIAIIISWFNKHDRQIPRHGRPAVSFLSCLFPEHRADRVYNVQEKRLEKIVGRSLQLGTTRLARLSSWRTANGADFAQTVQDVMSEAEFHRPRPEQELSLEEIDALFDRIAATYGGSSPELQTRILDPIAADEALLPLFRRLQSIEAKWLIRMFLKRYTPIELPERLIMRQFHSLLPDILCLQSCFAAAIRCLDDPAFSHIPPRPLDAEHEQAIKLEVASHLKPQVGVMVQRPTYDKARSIQHCCDMADRRRISVERKYDGEYCQIHIDIWKGQKCIKIFSKSGRDSTDDRLRLHGAIENALKLGKKDCRIKKQCILEGELLIWHDKKQQIQPFEKIRKHVARNGRFLGNDQDSPRDLHEKVMIMFYDLLVYDDLFCLNESLEQRRSRLRSIIRRVPGQAELGYREKINFASSDAKAMIRRAFAKCISRGWEGFVLKGCDDPYFSLGSSPRCIKLKKDYITGLGDMADLAIIGGRRIARDVQALNIGKLCWTTFHLACLENRDEVHRYSEKPRFRIVGVVSAAKKTLSPDRTRLFNELGQFERIPYASIRAEMEVVSDLNHDPPTELFKNPFVVEVVGGGFEKPANVSYHSLRFPRVTKIHEDRSLHDVMSFDELQELADKARAMATNEDSQEDREWIDRLIWSDPRREFVTENSVSTATGSDPGYAAATGLTSSAGCASTSSLPVRIDTQVMTGQESHDRRLPGGGGHSSLALPSKLINTSKRKLSMQEHSPPANLSTKRLKLSPQRKGTEAEYTSHGQRSKPPSCTPQRRKPLLEISNQSVAARMPSSDLQPSRQLPPDRIQQNQRRGNTLPTKERSTPDMLTLQGEKPSSSPSKQARYKILIETPLPTPPKSSPEEGRNGRAQLPLGLSSTTHESLPKVPGENRDTKVDGADPSPRKQKPRQQAPLVKTLKCCSSVIFLSPTATTCLSTDRHEIFSSFACVKTLFTFSREVFLDNMMKSSNMSHVAIVDVADPSSTGNEVGRIHQSILNKLRRDLYTPEGQLIFLDWKVLPLLGSEELSSEVLEPYFCGCLAWYPGLDVGEKQTWTVRDIWRWEKVMELANRI